MNKTILHTRIRKKFGTISKFAELARLDRYELQKIFARASPDTEVVANLMGVVKNTEVRARTREITTSQRMRLKEAVTEFGGPVKFCTSYPQFKEDVFFQIYSGRRKLLTPMVRELFTILKIE